MVDPEAVQRRMQSSLAEEIGQRVIELHEARAIAYEAQVALRDALAAPAPATEGAGGSKP